MKTDDYVGSHATCCYQELVESVLKLVHDAPGSAHPGKDRTLKQARLKYICPGITKDIKEQVERCHSGAVHKGHVTASALMVTYSVPDGPWESFTRCPQWINRDGKRKETSVSHDRHLLQVL